MKSKFKRKGSNSLFFVFIIVNSLIHTLKETIKDGTVICDNCDWTWKLSEGGKDPYICHKCGHDNTPKQKNNLDKILDKFAEFNPTLTPEISNSVKSFVMDFLKDKNYNIKFLPFCPSYSGVRTKDQIIVCSPSQMQSLGDFIYTLFHEIRHEQQISEIKMTNPLSEMDLDDFENLYQKYWEMELDADQYAKNMLKTLIGKLNMEKKKIPLLFKTSEFINNYPQASDVIKENLTRIVRSIKQMKKEGIKYDDIQDHPMVKPFIEKLEPFY